MGAHVGNGCGKVRKIARRKFPSPLKGSSIAGGARKTPPISGGCFERRLPDFSTEKPLFPQIFGIYPQGGREETDFYPPDMEDSDRARYIR